MRIRSLHPSYLDSKGLVALWRETLLAKHVLEGRTKGYTHHPQLIRFRTTIDPLSAINHYLQYIAQEATKRGYQFNTTKIGTIVQPIQIPLTKGQLKYEYQRLCKKLQTRDPDRYIMITQVKNIIPNPLFTIVEGDIEPREKI